MPQANFIIEINGEEIAELYYELIDLEVELSDDLPASFKLCMSLYKNSNGLWRYLDDEHFKVWNEIKISLGYLEGTTDEVLHGYITQVQSSFAYQEGQSMIEVTGIDASIRMDREEKLKAWPNKKDSDIVKEIFESYGFTAEVTDTEIVHDEAISTIIQRDTDYQFVKRLALRNGFDCYVEGGTAYFHATPVDLEPQPILAAHFGDETMLTSFSATIDALQPTHVAMFQLDRSTREILNTEVVATERELLGAEDAASLLQTGIDPAKIHIAKNSVTGLPEMEALCQGLFNEGAWFVSGEGTIDGSKYNHVLLPRRLVLIKGVGETYTGLYYVTHVKHMLNRDGYTQSFQAKRDGVQRTGNEVLTSNGLLGGLL